MPLHADGLRGIRRTPSGSWQARVRGKHLGCYETAEDAASAVDWGFALSRGRKRRGGSPPKAQPGEANVNAKLRAEDVPIIRALAAGTHPRFRRADYKTLALIYNVSVRTIGSVVRGETWRHIPGRTA
jgi:hypothetical protein